eukprot:5942339-Prymnesium_polylepis.1
MGGGRARSKYGMLSSKGATRGEAVTITRVGHGGDGRAELAGQQGGRQLRLALLLPTLIRLTSVALLEDVGYRILVDGAHAIDADLLELQQRRLAAVVVVIEERQVVVVHVWLDAAHHVGDLRAILAVATITLATIHLYIVNIATERRVGGGDGEALQEVTCRFRRVALLPRQAPRLRAICLLVHAQAASVVGRCTPRRGEQVLKALDVPVA